MKTSHSCPVCGSPDLVLKKSFMRKHLGSEGTTYTYELYQCDKCLNQHWSPLKHPGKEYYENENDSIYADMHKGRTKIVEERHLKFFSDYDNLPKSRILDIGCSDGLVLDQLKKMGHEVWGIDIDSISTQIAKNRGLENIFCMQWSDFLNLARKKNLQFDLITMFDVLEHVTDPVTFLNEINLLLKDGGSIVITVPNRERYLRDFIKTDFPPHHFFRFNEKSLRELAFISGYKVSKMNIIQYGYTSKIATNLLSKLVKNKIKNKQKQKQPFTTNEPEIQDHSNSKLKLIKLIQNLLFIPTFPLEIIFSKGYKIYTVISR
ncbi:class I SAM-dependent methyltransferase [Cyanobacterium aponinum UTEX 3222]|uniref:class I SAM-dependent methyltransferase n=1 Tax=Cyanobacterium aponinum TaxID=379064 RepID=UPI00309022E6|nr:class I SAM-dependent methyltransferase [Cyanobacterium aponinum UTEX 3222]